MLAVVQMVYPTIKSDARLSPGNPLLPRDSNAENSRMRGATRHERRVAGTSGKLDDPHLSSELSALSLTVSPLHLPGVALLSRSFFHQVSSFSLPLPRQFPSSPLLTHPPPLSPVTRARLTSGRRKKCVCVWTAAR